MTTAKNGQPTLSLEREGKTYYLHSAYNPEEEAGRLAARMREQAGEANRYKHLFFTARGWVSRSRPLPVPSPPPLRALPFTVYEPYPEVFRHYLATKPLSNLPLQALEGLHVGRDPASTAGFWRTTPHTSGRRSLLLYPPTKGFSRKNLRSLPLSSGRSWPGPGQRCVPIMPMRRNGPQPCQLPTVAEYPEHP